MSNARDVAVLVGSLRKASWSRKVANALIQLAPPPLALRVVEIGQLQLYNQDFDDEQRPPAEWTAFRNDVRKADAVLFVTPEYNRSVPGVLKNAVDVGSRPRNQSVWSRKPGAIVSVTTGKLGAFGANHHLRQALVFVDVPTMQQPEAYLGGADKMFDADGRLNDASTREFLSGFLRAFGNWIGVLAPPAAR